MYMAPVISFFSTNECPNAPIWNKLLQNPWKILNAEVETPFYLWSLTPNSLKKELAPTVVQYLNLFRWILAPW